MNVDDLGDNYFKVIKLFHVKFLANGALYGKSYYTTDTNSKSYTSFRLVPLLMTLKYI